MSYLSDYTEKRCKESPEFKEHYEEEFNQPIHALNDDNLIYVRGRNLPLTWEKSLFELYNKGSLIKTQYDAPDALRSLDCVGVIEVTDPMSEPRIHRGMPTGLEGLEEYRQEVLLGIHDHWIDPKNSKWEYSYHERMRNYTVPGIEKPIDQIQYCIDSIKDCPHTRRAQFVTWKAWEDAGIHDPACLQRGYFRVVNDKLDMHIHMRSNDAFRAAFMNMYAFTELQKYVAEETGYEVGRYIHIADSYHVYGNSLKDLNSFMLQAKQRTVKERTYDSTDEIVQEIIQDTRKKIIESLEEEKLTGRKGLRL